MNAITIPHADVCTPPVETALEAAHRITGRDDCGPAPMLDCLGMDPLDILDPMWAPLHPCLIPWGWEDCATVDAADEDDFTLYEDDFGPNDDYLDEMERNYWRDVLPRHLHR